jgi:hypothetical protein
MAAVTSLTLRQLEDEEQALKRALLVAPGNAEDRKRGVENKALHAKAALQREADALYEEANTFRARLRTVRDDMVEKRNQLQAALHGNAELERKAADAAARLAAAEKHRDECQRKATMNAGQRASSHERDGPSTGSVDNVTGKRANALEDFGANAVALRLNADEAESVVIDLRRQHMRLMTDVEATTEKLRKCRERKAQVQQQLISLRAVHNQLTTARADMNVLEAQDMEKDRLEMLARLQALDDECDGLIKERKGLICHLVDGFDHRSETVNIVRRKAIARASRAAELVPAAAHRSPSRGHLSPSGRETTQASSSSLESELVANSALRRHASDLIRNAATEHEMLENYLSVLQQRHHDVSLQRDLVAYEYELALSRVG